MKPPADQLDSGPLLRTPADDWRFDGARELRDYVRELVETRDPECWRMQPGDFKNVVIGTFARGTQSYRAVLLLCDRGYGEQAAMINRSLFEHSVTAWWMISQNSEEVMDSLRKQQDHARVLYERAAKAEPELDLYSGEDHEPFDPGYIAELDDRFRPFGTKTWHGKNLYELVRDVENAWDSPYEGTLWKFFRFVNHFNNYFLHHSSVGLVEAIEWASEDENPKIIMGPSSEWRMASLWAGYWSYGLLVQAVLKHIDDRLLGPFAEFFDLRAHRFQTVSIEQARDVGRNDPCPCSSGQKFKRCHEPFVGS